MALSFTISFGGLFMVALVAFLAPLLAGLAPGLRVPAVVVEIVAGIALGPSGLGWIQIDLAVAVLSLLGLAFLLFLAGLEVDFDRLRGRTLRLAATGLAVSLILALGVGLITYDARLVVNPLLVAIILTATSLGLVVPVLKDARQASTDFGQLVIASASLADFTAVILLSLLFSRDSRSVVARAGLLVGFAASVGLVGLTIARARRMATLSRVLLRLQDTTAQIRVRGAILLLAGLAALAARFGIELLLAAFMAGAILALTDRDEQMTHPGFQPKLQAVGYGFLIPIFFISSGLQFDLRSLTGSPEALAKIPIFVLALLLVRGLPAGLYLGLLSARQALAAAFLQATSLPFIVAATQIGVLLGLLSHSTAAALVAAGLVSVIAFPISALGLLRQVPAQPADMGGGGAQRRPDELG